MKSKKEILRKRLIKTIKEKDFQIYLIDKINKYLDCGALDFERVNNAPKGSSESDFSLDKCVLHVAILDLANIYKPFHPDNIKIVKNLKHF